jgi:hypothetical protein
MAITNKSGYEPAETDFLVTYATTNGKLPTSYQVMSLPEFHHILCTQNRAMTENQPELCPLNTSPWKRRRQYRRMEAIFPFVAAGVLYGYNTDEVAQLKAKWGQPTRPELVILTFEYASVQTDAARTATNRERLQKRLLADPLLGPSVVLMYKGPGECLVHVLVAAGPMRGYAACVNTISTYIQSACPKLRTQLYRADGYVRTPRLVGFDPLAWLRPRPAAGYALFPVRLAQGKIAECE